MNKLRAPPSASGPAKGTVYIDIEYPYSCAIFAVKSRLLLDICLTVSWCDAGVVVDRDMSILSKARLTATEVNRKESKQLKKEN